MREESHLDDMRSAIRGDFERLAERRGGQELMRTPEPEDEPAAPEEDSASEPEPVREATPEQAVPEQAEEAPVAPEGGSEGEPRRRSLLDRLLGR